MQNWAWCIYPWNGCCCSSRAGNDRARDNARYWRSQPRAILRPDASSRRRQFAYRRSKFVIEKRIASHPHKIEPITPMLVVENFVERETHRLSRAMRDIACTHARKYMCNNAREAIRHLTTTNRNSSRGEIALRSTRAFDRFFYSPLFPYG